MYGIISDITGKNVNMEDTYSLKVYNRATKCTLEIDMESTAKDEKLADLMALAIGNGRKWSVWSKENQKYEPAK